MKAHETSQCSWRKVNCEYCQESVIMNQKQVCNMFDTVYPFYLDLGVLKAPLETLFQTFAIIRLPLAIASFWFP